MSLENQYESKLDERKLKRMKYLIIELEKENSISKKRKKDEMVDEIRKIIENEVKRCY